MATGYPNSVDNTTLLPTNSGVGETLADFPHDELHGNVNDAVRAIETELGTNPKGGSASVKARLDAMPIRAGCTLTATSGVLAAAGSTGVVWLTEVVDTNGYISAPHTTVTIPAGLGGIYGVHVHVETDSSGILGVSLTCENVIQFADADSADGVGANLSYIGPLAATDVVQVSVNNPGSEANIVSAVLSVYRISL